MIILPYKFFRISLVPRGPVIFTRIEISDEVLVWLKKLLHCNKIKRNGTCKRIIKHVTVPDRNLLLPRVITDSTSQRSHVVLPDFVLPYSNYTVKSLFMVFTDFISQQTAIKLTVKQWDYLNSHRFQSRYLLKMLYIKSRKEQLLKRYILFRDELFFIGRKELTDFLQTSSCIHLRPYYFITNKTWYISPLTYLSNTVSYNNSG